MQLQHHPSAASFAGEEVNTALLSCSAATSPFPPSGSQSLDGTCLLPLAFRLFPVFALACRSCLSTILPLPEPPPFDSGSDGRMAGTTRCAGAG
eukprot:scaffold2125_cov363-Pavlova_lutheri.AAC.4